jgi:predicted Zn-dependent protease
MKPKRHRIWLLATGLVVLLGGGVVTKQARDQAHWRQASLPELETAVAQRPQDGALRALLAGHLIQAGEHGAARFHLEKAVQSGTSDEAIWLNIAALTALTDTKKAQEILEHGKQQHPKSTLLDEAAQRLEYGLRLNPDAPPPQRAQFIHPEPGKDLIQHFGQGGLMNFLVADGYATRYEAALVLPEDVETQLLWAMMLLKNRRVGEMCQITTRLRARAPQRFEVQYLAAECALAQGRIAEAEKLFTLCRQERPDDIMVQIGSAQVALASGLLVDARAGFEKITQRAPDNPEGWIGLGRTLNALRHAEKQAVVALEKVRQLAPGRTDYYVAYADALKSDYQYKQAEAVLRARLVQAPEDAFCLYKLGSLLSEQGAPAKEVEVLLQDAHRKQPNAASISIRLATFLIEQKRPAEAIPLVQSGIAHGGNTAAHWSLLARAYQQVGRPTDAQSASTIATRLRPIETQIDALEKQMQTHPDDAQVQQKLIILYREADRIAAAPGSSLPPSASP